MERDLSSYLIRIGLELGWDKVYAKWAFSRHQSLLYHSLNVAILTDRLASILNVNEKVKRALVIGAFFHDFAKRSEKLQKRIILGKKVKVRKIGKQDIELVSKYMKQLGLNNEELELALGAAFLGELPTDAHDLLEQLRLPSIPRLVQDDRQECIALKIGMDGHRLPLESAPGRDPGWPHG